MIIINSFEWSRNNFARILGAVFGHTQKILTNLCLWHFPGKGEREREKGERGMGKGESEGM